MPANPRRTTAFVVLLCAAWIVPGLVGHDPWKPDEGYTFGLVHGILVTGDRVVPTLAGEPFMEKPPLFFATAAATARLAAPWLPLHDGARLANALYLLAAFLLVGLAARALWGKGYGAVSVLVLLGCPGLLIHAHRLITDVALFAGFAAAYCGLAVAQRRPLAAGLLVGTGVGVGFLSKGLVAPVVVGLTALSLPALFASWRSRRYAATLLVALACALPALLAWPIALYLRSPKLFTDWIWLNNAGRYFGFANLGPRQTPGFYFYTLPYVALPALPLAYRTLRRSREKGPAGAPIQLCVTSFLVLLVVLGTASDAREVYALPMLLPLALLAAPGAVALPKRAAILFERIGVGLFGGIGLLLGLGGAALAVGQPAALGERLFGTPPGLAPGIGLPAVAAALGLSALWGLGIARFGKSPVGAVAAWAAGITLTWGLAMTLWLPGIDAGKSYRPVVASMRQALPADYRGIAGRDLGESERALFAYFGNLRIDRVETSENAMLESDLLLVETRGGASPGAEPGWTPIWEGRRAGDGRESFLLYQKDRGLAKRPGPTPNPVAVALKRPVHARTSPRS